LQITQKFKYDVVTSSDELLNLSLNEPIEQDSEWDGLVTLARGSKLRPMKRPRTVPQRSEEGMSQSSSQNFEIEVNEAKEEKNQGQLTRTMDGPTLFDLTNMIKFWVEQKAETGNYPTRTKYRKAFDLSISSIETVMDYCLTASYLGFDLRSVHDVTMKLKTIKLPVFEKGKHIKDHDGKPMYVTLARKVSQVRSLDASKKWKRGNFVQRCIEGAHSLRYMIN